MKKSYSISSTREIDKVVYDLMKQSRSFDQFPTPVKQLVRYSELQVDGNADLHTIPNHYISKKIDVLKTGLSKIFGALDRRKKVIYLNPQMVDGKKNFVQL